MELELSIHASRTELLLVMRSKVVRRVFEAGRNVIDGNELPDNIRDLRAAAGDAGAVMLHQNFFEHPSREATFLHWEMETAGDGANRLWDDVIPLRAEVLDFGTRCDITFWLDIEAFKPVLDAILEALAREYPAVANQVVMRSSGWLAEKHESLQIDLYETVMDDYVYHFREWFEDSRNFYSHVSREWRGFSLVWGDTLPDWLTQEEIEQKGYIKFIEKHRGKSVTFSPCHVLPSGHHRAFYAMTAHQYSTNRVRIYFMDFVSGGFDDAFLHWLQYRWADLAMDITRAVSYGYVHVGSPPAGEALTPTQKRVVDLTADGLREAWRVNGRPVEPAKFKELVEQGVIDPKTNNGAAVTLAWAKEYQKVNGQQSLHVTRDIELWANVSYQTLRGRAGKVKTIL